LRLYRKKGSPYNPLIAEERGAKRRRALKPVTKRSENFSERPKAGVDTN
jgi:hypothetical protein